MASTSSPGSPGLTSNAVLPCSSTSAIWSRALAAIALPIAMYSNNLVGDPKNGLPPGIGTCGETRMSATSRYARTDLCGTAPVKVTRPWRVYGSSAFRNCAASSPSPTRRNFNGPPAGWASNNDRIACSSTPTPCQ